MVLLELNVNGKNVQAVADITTSLLTVLREQLYATGTKIGCESGTCGSCSVLINGKLHNACLTNAFSAQGKQITTIEGIGEPGDLHPLQKQFYEKYASQCGFCTPGMIMAAKALIDVNPDPTEEEIKEALSGNLCRCTGYINIIKAVRAAANDLVEQGGEACH